MKIIYVIGGVIILTAVLLVLFLYSLSEEEQISLDLEKSDLENIWEKDWGGIEDFDVNIKINK